MNKHTCEHSGINFETKEITITHEELNKMNLRSYNEGQRDGYNLASNSIVTLIRANQQAMEKFFEKELEKLK